MDTEKGRNIVLRFGSRTIECGLEGSGKPLESFNVHHFAELQTFGVDTNNEDHSHVPDCYSQKASCDAKIQQILEDDLVHFRHLFYLDTLIYNDFELFARNLKFHLRKVLVKVFYKCGLSTINSKLLLIQNLNFPTIYNKIITDILVNELLMRAVVILPAPLMASIGSGSSFSLVVDIGWSLTTIVPVFDYRVLNNYLNFTSRAGSRLHYELLSALAENGLDIESISFRDIENTISLLDRVGDDSSDDSELITCGDFLVKKKLFTDVIKDLYFDYDASVLYETNEIPIVKLIKDLVEKQLPIDLKKSILSRIIITGGISRIRGFRQIMLSRINKLILQESSGIETLGEWSGASIYSSIMKNQKKSGDLLEIRKM